MRDDSDQRTVLFVVKAFPPAESAGIHRIVRFARHLADYGWRAAVFCEGHGEGLDPQAAEAFDLPFDIPVRRHSLTEPAGVRATGSSSAEDVDAGSRTAATSGVVVRAAGVFRALARNAVDLLTKTPDSYAHWSKTGTRSLSQFASEVRPDVVFSSGPPHSIHALGRRVARQSHAAWVADFRDPWARKPWGLKESNPWGQRLNGRLEAACVRSADLVILNTPRLEVDFRLVYPSLPASRFACVPNGVDPRLVELADDLMSNAESPPGPPLLLHPGSLYRKRDPLPVLSAVSLLRDRGRPVRLKQLGPCDPSFKWDEVVGRLGISDLVSFEESVPHADCLRQMAEADGYLLLQPGTDLQVPGKLFEMACFGRPVVAVTDEGATADLVRGYGLGAVAPCDAEAIAEAICAAFEGKPADVQRFRTDFDAALQAAELSTLLEGILPSRGRAEALIGGGGG